MPLILRNGKYLRLFLVSTTNLLVAIFFLQIPPIHGAIDTALPLDAAVALSVSIMLLLSISIQEQKIAHVYGLAILILVLLSLPLIYVWQWNLTTSKICLSNAILCLVYVAWFGSKKKNKKIRTLIYKSLMVLHFGLMIIGATVKYCLVNNWIKFQSSDPDQVVVFGSIFFQLTNLVPTSDFRFLGYLVEPSWIAITSSVFILLTKNPIIQIPMLFVHYWLFVSPVSLILVCALTIKFGVHFFNTLVELNKTHRSLLSISLLLLGYFLTNFASYSLGFSNSRMEHDIAGMDYIAASNFLAILDDLSNVNILQSSLVGGVAWHGTIFWSLLVCSFIALNLTIANTHLTASLVAIYLIVHPPIALHWPILLLLFIAHTVMLEEEAKSTGCDVVEGLDKQHGRSQLL